CVCGIQRRWPPARRREVRSERACGKRSAAAVPFKGARAKRRLHAAPWGDDTPIGVRTTTLDATCVQRYQALPAGMNVAMRARMNLRSIARSFLTMGLAVAVTG